MQRLLRKIDGREPVFERPIVRPMALSGELSAEERELVALCRSRGRELPPELAKKLRELEERAAKPPEPDTEEEERRGTD